MRGHIAVSAVAAALLTAGCGTSSGLHVESNGTTTPIVKPAGAQPQVDNLDAVAFPSTRDGWAAGRGAIIATADGGATWTQQYTGQADIRSLDFTDDRHGWAVASASLLRTVTAAPRWSPAGEPAGLIADRRRLRRPRRWLGRRTARGQGRGAGPGHAGRHHRRRLQLDASSRRHRRLGLPGGWRPGRRRGIHGAAVDRRRARHGAPCSTPAARRRPGSRRASSARTCSRSGCCSRAAGPPAARPTPRTPAPTGASAGSRWWSSPMLVGSNSRFAGVTPLDSYSGPFAAVSASKAVFLGECPACDPQRVTVLRTHDGGTHWERSVVDGFAPTGLSFADAAHGWMTAVIGGTEGGGRRSSPPPTAAARGGPCIRHRYRTVTRPPPHRDARLVASDMCPRDRTTGRDREG